MSSAPTNERHTIHVRLRTAFAVLFGLALGMALVSRPAFAFESSIAEGPAQTDLQVDPSSALTSEDSDSNSELSALADSSEADATMTTQSDSQVVVYRVYSESLSEHLFTTDTNEVRTLVASGNWTYEGAGWFAPLSTAANVKPVYRLFQASTNQHLYTTDENEIKTLTTKYGWGYDNNGQPLFYSGGDISIYRLFNVSSLQHHYTTDANEYKVLPTWGTGWQQEGVKLNCVALGNSSYPFPGNGTCGSCTWDTTDGTLTIRPTNGTSGTLDSVGYDQSNYITKAPWASYVDSITKVVVKSGVKAGAKASLFGGLHNVTEMDLSGLDASATTDMSFMFADCASLKTLTLPNLKSSNVTNMAAMFAGCTTLETLDISNLNSSNVTNMWIMFYKCYALKTLNMGGSFSTKAAAASSAINSMANYFYGCHALTQVTLGAGYVAKATSSIIPAPGEPYIAGGTGRWVSQTDGKSYMPTQISSGRTSTVTYTAQIVSGAVPVYRLYKEESKEHLYTTDGNEVRTLAAGDWSYEGTAWMAPSSGDNVYRLFSSSQNLHHYTSAASEISALTTKYGWVLDFNGAAVFKSGGEIAVYRLLNRSTGQHLFTTDQNETVSLPKLDSNWVQESSSMKCEAEGSSTYPMPPA